MTSNNNNQLLVKADAIMIPQVARRFTPAPAPDRDTRDDPAPHCRLELPYLVSLAAVGVPTLAVASAPAVQAVEAAPVAVDTRVVSAPELVTPHRMVTVAAEPTPAGGADLSPFWGQDDSGAVPAPAGPPSAEPLSGSTTPSQRVVEGTVTVRAGESLWTITEQLLGSAATDARVSTTWPQLWQANGDRVPDPDLLQPGTVLVLPDSMMPR